MSKKVLRKERKERLNELNGKAWTKYSISVWNIIKTPQERKLKHPAMFPKELVERLIEIFTKKGDSVLDPFMGSGTTILGARDLGRKGIGFEISEEYIDLLKKRLENPIPPRSIITKLIETESDLTEIEYIKPDIYQEDARNLHRFISPKSIDFVITSPPYWDILRQKRTSDYKESRPYTESESDLGNISSYNEFLCSLQSIFKNVHTVLKEGKWCIIIVMDIRKLDKFYPFHSHVAEKMTDIGFKFEDIIIWDRGREYNNLRPLGYPYVFRVNKIHEYILFFSKEAKKTD